MVIDQYFLLTRFAKVLSDDDNRRLSSSRGHLSSPHIILSIPPNFLSINPTILKTKHSAAYSLGRRSRTSTCNIEASEIGEEPNVGIGKARPTIRLNRGHTIPSKVVVASLVRSITGRAKELANKTLNDYLGDIVENTALEETLAVVGVLNGVAVVVFPDAVDRVEEGATAECWATARGAINVVV